MNKVKWYEEDTNVTSFIRIGAMIATINGVIISLSGVVGWFAMKADSLLIIGAGTGLITLALGLKTLQRKLENQNQTETKTEGSN